MLRFSENHDERRAALAFGAERGKAAAAVILTLPGAKLVYHGQLAGRKLTTSVFLRRAPDEDVDDGAAPVLCSGCCTPCETSACSKVSGACVRLQMMTAAPRRSLYWRGAGSVSERRYLLAINYAGTAYQGQIRTPWIDLAGQTWQVRDLLSDEGLKRSGEELDEQGLWVDLPPWGLQLMCIFPDAR